jgi:hypothetical protein
VAQAVVATSAPVVQTAAPVTQTVNATVATTTQPVQSVVKPAIRQVTTIAAPVVQAAPVIQQVSAPVAQTAAMAANTLVPPTEPVIAPVTQTVAATAPATTAIMTIAPALRTIVADAGDQSVAPAAVAPVNRAEQPRVAPGALPTPPTARTVDAVGIAPFVGVAPATAPPMIALPIVHRATAVAAEVRTAPPAATSGISRTAMASRAPFAWVAAASGDAGMDVPALSQAIAFDDQSEQPPSIAPAMPHSPTSPPRLPTDALATTTSATGTSGGHGFPLLLSLATAGWALVLVGRRLFPSALNPPQPTSRPLVSPG